MINPMQSEFVVVYSNFPVWDKMIFLGHLKEELCCKNKLSPTFEYELIDMTDLGI